MIEAPLSSSQRRTTGIQIPSSGEAGATEPATSANGKKQQRGFCDGKSDTSGQLFVSYCRDDESGRLYGRDRMDEAATFLTL